MFQINIMFQKDATSPNHVVFPNIVYFQKDAMFQKDATSQNELLPKRMLFFERRLLLKLMLLSQGCYVLNGLHFSK